MKIWQIACGEPQRDYRDVFLNHDVMLIGPGDPGSFEESQYLKARENEDISSSQYSQISAFHDKPAQGDIVLLRLGHKVIRVGIIPDEKAGGYLWSEAFSDVKEWDLQHSRRVLWGDPDLVSIIQGERPLFSNYKQQPTFTQVHETRIIEKAKELQGRFPKRKLKDLPANIKDLTTAEFGDELFKVGLSNESVEKAIEAIEKATRLNDWYWGESETPSEHEIIAHMTIPLMLALGWSEQLLAVEWDKIDLAFFDRAPREAKNCIMICEAKRPHKPLEGAFEQAKSYVVKRKLSNCRKILITSGTRLLIYSRSGQDWVQRGYVNLARLRDKYVSIEQNSAADSLIGIIPSRINQ